MHAWRHPSKAKIRWLHAVKNKAHVHWNRACCLCKWLNIKFSLENKSVEKIGKFFFEKNEKNLVLWIYQKDLKTFPIFDNFILIVQPKNLNSEKTKPDRFETSFLIRFRLSSFYFKSVQSFEYSIYRRFSRRLSYGP